MDNLNKAIAEQVFGNTGIERRICSWYPDDSFWSECQEYKEENAVRYNHSVQLEPGQYEAWQWCYKQVYAHGGHDWIVIPDYSVNIKSAFDVVAKMRDLGYVSRYYESEYGLYTHCHQWIFTDPKRDWNVSFRADTVPLAICHAALRMIASVQRG